MKDAVSSYLEARLYTDVHDHHQSVMRLGGMRCTQIANPAKDAVVGDLLYHYSDQLDAFSLYEVVAINPERTKCRVYTIDQDAPEVYRGYDNEWHNLHNGYDKFYHPNPTDRKYVEQHGFSSANVPLFAAHSRPNEWRHLSVRLYYRTRGERLRAWFDNLLGRTP